MWKLNIKLTLSPSTISFTKNPPSKLSRMKSYMKMPDCQSSKPIFLKCSVLCRAWNNIMTINLFANVYGSYYTTCNQYHLVPDGNLSEDHPPINTNCARGLPCTVLNKSKSKINGTESKQYRIDKAIYAIFMNVDHSLKSSETPNNSASPIVTTRPFPASFGKDTS